MDFSALLWAPLLLLQTSPAPPEVVHAGRPISSWIADLTSKKDEVREKAHAALRAIGEPAVPALLERLSAPAADARRTAAAALGNLGDKRALEPLVALLRDGDQGVRMVAADALGNLRDERAVPALVTALTSAGRKGPAFWAPIRALAAIGGDEALAAMGQLATGDPSTEVRQNTTRLLGSLVDPRTIEPLSRALKDADPSVREVAAESLGKIDSPRVLEILEAASKDRALGASAAAVLKEIDTRGKPTQTQGHLQVSLMGLELTKQWGDSFNRLSAKGDNDLAVLRYRIKFLAAKANEAENVELYDADGARLPSAQAAAGMFSFSTFGARKAGEAITTQTVFSAKKGTKFQSCKIQGMEFSLADVTPSRQQ